MWLTTLGRRQLRGGYGAKCALSTLEWQNSSLCLLLALVLATACLINGAASTEGGCHQVMYVAGNNDYPYVVGLYILQSGEAEDRPYYLHACHPVYLYYNLQYSSWWVGPILGAPSGYAILEVDTPTPTGDKASAATWRYWSPKQRHWFYDEGAKLVCLNISCRTFTMSGPRIPSFVAGEFHLDDVIYNDRPVYENTASGFFLYHGRRSRGCDAWQIGSPIGSDHGYMYIKSPARNPLDVGRNWTLVNAEEMGEGVESYERFLDIRLSCLEYYQYYNEPLNDTSRETTASVTSIRAVETSRTLNMPSTTAKSAAEMETTIKSLTSTVTTATRIDEVSSHVAGNVTEDDDRTPEITAVDTTPEIGATPEVGTTPELETTAEVDTAIDKSTDEVAHFTTHSMANKGEMSTRPGSNTESPVNLDTAPVSIHDETTVDTNYTDTPSAVVNTVTTENTVAPTASVNTANGDTTSVSPSEDITIISPNEDTTTISPNEDTTDTGFNDSTSHSVTLLDDSDIGTSTESPFTALPVKCGQRLRHSLAASFLISGTNVPYQGKWPWMVAILTASNRTQCGAALLSSRYLVTAAHCIDGSIQKIESYRLVLGANNRDNGESGVEHRSIRATFLHPNFTYTSSPFRINHDIGIAELNVPVNFTDYIQPICLPENDDVAIPLKSDQSVESNFTSCYITGFGYMRVDATGRMSSTGGILQEQSVGLTPIAWCTARYFSYYRWLSATSNMCVHPHNFAKLCKGDSGSPLMCLRNSQWTLVGVASWSLVACISGNFPAVYADARQHADWIRQQISVLSTSTQT